MTNLFPRLISLPKNKSFFVFGARNTGKSTYIAKHFNPDSVITIDLLKKSNEARFLRDPDELYEIVQALPTNITHVFIDEIQKNPALLDVVHRLMNDTDKYFILSGSSARKLKRGGANLLAGRAFVYHMYPLTSIELGEAFQLEQILQWGSLPQVITCENDADRSEFLYAYTNTYLKEEIWSEQFVRNLDPFRHFLEIAAQSNGKMINFSNIARDIGISDKAVQNYYSILTDTMLGFFLEAYHGSFRKRLSKQPKFYLFDLGIVRALTLSTDIHLTKRTFAYGKAFEHFIILECIRLADYYRLHYRFSFIRTQEGVEIDLVVERPGKPLLCIEIKSAEIIERPAIGSFINLTKEIENSEAICICTDEFVRKIEHVTIYPWKLALKTFFTHEAAANSK